LRDPISKKPVTNKKKKRGGGVAQGVGPEEFKPQYHTHTKKKKEKEKNKTSEYYFKISCCITIYNII
jgi:hypothetical protein